MTAVEMTWRGAVERFWPLVVAVLVTLVVNPALGSVAACVLALLRWKRDRPVAVALVVVGVLGFAYLVAFTAARVG